MELWYLTSTEFMHQYPCAVYIITKYGNEFTIVAVLEIFPGKIIVFCFGHIGTKNITQYIFATGKVFYIFMRPNGPVPGSGNFITFNIQEFVSRNIVGQDKIAVRFQHSREYDTMENDIVFTNEMDQLCIILAPVVSPLWRKLFRSADITDRCIKPNIKYLSFCVWQGNFDTPVTVSGHRPALQSIIQPAFALAINIVLPFLMTFQEPFF